MKMKSKLSFVALFCLGAVVLAGCGNGGETSSDPTTTSTPTTTTTTTTSTTPAHEHTMGENGFCSSCGAYLGDTFAFTDQESYFDFVHEQFDMAENEKYYCRISGGHSGHIFELEDGDPQPSIYSGLSAYTFIDNVKTAINLDGDTPETIGNDGYLYITIDASLLSNRDDVWFRICELHVAPVSPVAGTLAYLGFCQIDGVYTGYTHNLNATMSPTIAQGEYVYRRVAVTSDTEYGLWDEANDHVENTSKVEAFAIVDNAPVLLETGYDYDCLLMHFPENASDNHIYLVYSYEGTQPSAHIESVSVKSLTHAHDNNRFYYGDICNDLIGDSTDFEGRSINGKYYVGFNPDDYANDAYEIYLMGTTSFTLSAYQDNGSAVVALETDGGGNFLPVSAETIVIEVESTTPGSQIDVYVVKHARA